MAQTEIQFLVSLMMEHKLPVPVKDKLIARIGEVEATLSKAPNAPVRASPAIQQSVRMPTPDELDAPPVQARKIIPQEIVTATGNGTSVRGPRKF